ncbi:hypothetical protein GpartN1_g2468.t1 [Galdieria partita]|uniref:Uncharacterized protein n=1 Tax=Galdieria partita TaxID=83374 RepID=A0A9C7PW25_9RHOD|nr:hypothetical protein GpartN1_g2468.t1 [Galdieria partita]
MNLEALLLQSPFAQDLTNLIHDFIDQWLFQIYSGLPEPLSFPAFCKPWKESNFEIIHVCGPKRLKPELFLQQLFQNALLFFERPYLVKLPKLDEYLDFLKEELYFVIQVACVYTLYLLYVTQKVESTPEKIRIDVVCFNTLLSWLMCQKLEDREDGSKDTLKLLVNLLKKKAIRLCYFRLPLQLPQNLFEPAHPPVFFEYELEAKESGSEESTKSKDSTDEIRQNSAVNNLWSRTGEILTTLELERLEKSWERWEAFLELLHDQKPCMSQVSSNDGFHEDIRKMLERARESLTKD